MHVRQMEARGQLTQVLMRVRRTRDRLMPHGHRPMVGGHLRTRVAIDLTRYRRGTGGQAQGPARGLPGACPYGQDIIM